ncbi:MAG: hypothetical protein R6X18_17530 [Chloroflexota bacterium]
MKKYRVLIIIVLILALAACNSISGIADLAGSPTASSSETQGVIVEGVPNLTVNHFAGKINVREGDPGRISADLTKMSRLRDQDQAQAQLNEINMTITQRGTDVVLTVEGPQATLDMIASPTADLELTVPPGSMLNLNLGAGDISIDEPDGDVVVNGGAGNITVTLPPGTSFNLQVAGGVTRVNSDFPGVPGGGVAANVETTVGDNPTQSLSFNLGAGEVNINQSR